MGLLGRRNVKVQGLAKPPSSARPLDAESILRELSRRWHAARTLEYRSRAVLNHAGELQATFRNHACLRRPSFLRVVFDGTSRPDFTRQRVCDGRRWFDKGARGVPLRSSATMMAAFAGNVTANLPHPLDEVSYCVGQFFAPAPFAPPARWGEPGQPRTITGETVSTPAALATLTRSPDVLRLRIARGHTSDTLTLEPISLRPLEIVRVGDHAGVVQELLRETFLSVVLGAYLPPERFEWSDADERGDTLARETAA